MAIDKIIRICPFLIILALVPACSNEIDYKARYCGKLDGFFYVSNSGNTYLSHYHLTEDMINKEYIETGEVVELSIFSEENSNLPRYIKIPRREFPSSSLYRVAISSSADGSSTIIITFLDRPEYFEEYVLSQEGRVKEIVFQSRSFNGELQQNYRICGGEFSAF